MRVLFLSHYCGLLGSNRSLDSLITHFIDKGEEVTILLPSRGEFYQHISRLGRDVHSFMFIYETLYVKKNKKYLTLPLLWVYNFFAFPLLLYKIYKVAFAAFPEIVMVDVRRSILFLLFFNADFGIVTV